MESKTKLIIEISDLYGYQIKKDGRITDWDTLTREEQLHIIDSFIQGYKLFYKYVKEE